MRWAVLRMQFLEISCVGLKLEVEVVYQSYLTILPVLHFFLLIFLVKVFLVIKKWPDYLIVFHSTSHALDSTLLSTPAAPSQMKLRALAAVHALLHPSPSTTPAPSPQRSRRGLRLNYQTQLEFKTPVAPWIPTVTPLKPPRAQLLDPTTPVDTL